MRAGYLLDTLRHRGFTWPEVEFLPETDGGVCSFLGTVDPSFDMDHNIHIQEDKEHEEFLVANRARIQARFDDLGLYDSEDTPNASARKSQVKSAEAPKEETSHQGGKSVGVARPKKKAKKNGKVQVQVAPNASQGKAEVDGNGDEWMKGVNFKMRRVTDEM